MRILVSVLSALVLASCASNEPPDPRIAETRAGVERERTAFDSHTRYQGPEQALGGSTDGFALMRSWREAPDRRAQHQLYVHVVSEGRGRDFLSANQPGGGKLALKQVDSGPACDAATSADCPVYEDVGVWISDKMLKNAIKSGSLQLRLNARRGGSVVVSLPAWYLEGYLQALD